MGSLEFHIFCLLFCDKVLLCISGWPPIHESSASASGGFGSKAFSTHPQLNELYSLFSSQKLLRGNYSRASKLVLTALFFSSVSHQILPEDFQVPAPLACSLPYFPKL